MQQTELDALGILAAQARTLPDACRAVDVQKQTLLTRIGFLREYVSRGSMTSAQANQQASAACAEFRASMHRIIEAGRYVEPLAVVPLPDPQQQAVNVVAAIEATGAILHASVDGSIEIRSASKVTEHLRSMAGTLRSEIVALLRKDVVSIPAPRHRHT